ncbi:cytotoxic T-lymphocyte protein 4 [Silurus meridionalis]|uniref:Immunoglobulin V-set domain-containing protein n=1 Tax=Silurus meridionalis TaxID=175797 RepID=A0A8T0BT92_SILME|nr:cytotoxic T-lymphocyte protein 4 [Silurus meridionalis]KAF7709653.1 hypothetical protein HF521_016503 [Silurus meridionalis]KAI5107285.1 cytotoxic T-lymphocyte protein 4 [Silurus meridionalis]
MFVCVIILIVGFPLGHALSVSQPYYALGEEGRVSIYCTVKAKLQPEEMQVTVYKGMHGEKRICSAYVNTSNPHIETNGRIYCRGIVNKERVDLTIFGLRGEDTDLYRCQIDVIFPPPYISRYGNGTLIYIPDRPDCPPEHSQARIMETPEITYNQTLAFPNILLFAILITTTITLILQVMKMILTRRKSNHMTQTLSQKGDYRNFW